VHSVIYKLAALIRIIWLNAMKLCNLVFRKSSKKSFLDDRKLFFADTSGYVPGQRNLELTELPEPMRHWKCPILQKWPPRGHGHIVPRCTSFSIRGHVRLVHAATYVAARTRGESRILHRKQITEAQSFDVRRCYDLRDYLRSRWHVLVPDRGYPAPLFCSTDDYSFI